MRIEKTKTLDFMRDYILQYPDGIPAKKNFSRLPSNAVYLEKPVKRYKDEVITDKPQKPFTWEQIKTYQRSLLRYPGGKSRGVKEIIKFFPPDIDKVCSPFLGGGSIELALAHAGVKVFGYDVFEPLTSFWKELLENAEGLADKVSKYYPLTKSKFYSLQLKYKTIQDKQERAAVFFVLNRSSFSGTTFSGGMSPQHPRFTLNVIEKLKQFKIKNLIVENLDFKVSLKKNSNSFLYLDPPYANGEKLYGERGSTHEYFDHEGLADILKKRDGWLLSYNDCPMIRKFYDRFYIHTLNWAYGMNNSKRSNEILILSKDIKV